MARLEAALLSEGSLHIPLIRFRLADCAHFLDRSVDPKNRSQANSGKSGRKLSITKFTMKANLVPSVVSILVATSFLIGASAKGQGLSAEEQQFVKKAAAGGLAEVKLSELAGDRASDAKVKAFAAQMVTDHTQANNELKPIADANKIPVPTKLQGESEVAYKHLEKLSSAKFD